MKRFYKSLLLPVVAVFLSIGLNAQKTRIQSDNLPEKAQKFLKDNFSNEKVLFVEKDNYLGRIDYDVVLSNGTEIEFDAKGNWKEVDAQNKEALPTGFIPKKILQYIQQNFSTQTVSKIEKERTKYEVELTNGIDLEFNSKGDFLRMDD